MASTPTAITAPPPIRPGQRGSFTVTEEGITWKCAVCDNENPLDYGVCQVCGAAFAATVLPPEPEREPRDPGTAALLSLVFPGAGHAYLGLWGQAVARGVISFWVVSVAVVAAIQRGVPGALALAVLFGLAAFGLWAVAAHDAYREARMESAAVLLRGRIFMYVVLGLLALLMLLMIPAALSVRAG